MAIYKIVLRRTGSTGSSTLDSGFTERTAARRAVYVRLSEEMARRLATIDSEGLKHRLTVGPERDGSITLGEDCECVNECRDMESRRMFWFEVRSI